MGEFKRFARIEIYAFLWLTAILTTFFMAAGFTLFAFKQGDLVCWAVRWSFYIMEGLGVINIGLVWLYSWRTIFKYYVRMEDSEFLKTDIYKKITDNAGKWRSVIWFTFLACYIFFIAFLVIVLSS